MGDELKELKCMLRSLVVSSPTQVDVRSLVRDYSHMVGGPLPLAKFGYRNAVDFIKERCSDCFLLGGPDSNPVLTLIVPDTLKHIDQFVQRQKVPSTAKFKSKRRSIPETKVKPPEQDNIFKTFVKCTPPVIEEPKKSQVKAPDIVNNKNDNKENVEEHKPAVTSNDVKNFLKKRLPAYTHIQQASSENDMTLSLAQDNDSGKMTTSSSSSTKALQFEELKCEILELITSAPEGIWCTDLIRLYRERYKRELNFTRFGYTSIISVVYALEQRVHIARPDDTGDWLLQDRRRAPAAPQLRRPRRALAPAAPAVAAPHDPDDALPGIDFDPDVFPEDCVHFMESIPSMSLADCKPGAMLEVIVGEVYSPSHFWLIRLGDNYNIAMEDMMDEMTRYYNGEGRDRVLARGAIRVGHYCSSLYERDWHRSLIVKILDSDTVKVRHVDYGTVDTVRAAELRALRRCWAALPAQAVRARLAGVRPPAAGRRWPHAAAAHFLRLVRDTRLVANVVGVDADEDVLETLLIDTRGAADACVSAALVRAGHADARADSALRTAECYLYPRFEALESGATPNLAEIHAYLRDGIALDYVDAYRRHVPLCLPPHAPAPPAPPSPPPSPEPPSPPPSPCVSDHSELATRIPLLLPAASPPAPATPASHMPSTSPLSRSAAESPPQLSSPAQKQSASEAISGVPVGPPPAPLAVPQLPVPPPACAMFQPPPYPAAPMFPAAAGGQWFGPYPVPGTVSLSVAECETYRMLARVNPAAAHWFMAGALGRAMRPCPDPLGRAMGPCPGPLGRAMGPCPGPLPAHQFGPVGPPPGFGP